MEVKMGELALEKASNKKILEFAKMMMDEHTIFNKEFMLLLKELHEKIPIELNERNRQMVEELSKFSGKEFENKYVETMVQDHMFAVQEFKKALQVAKNDKYRKFLEHGTAIVQHHYEMAQKLQKETVGK